MSWTIYSGSPHSSFCSDILLFLGRPGDSDKLLEPENPTSPFGPGSPGSPGDPGGHGSPGSPGGPGTLFEAVMELILSCNSSSCWKIQF